MSFITRFSQPKLLVPLASAFTVGATVFAYQQMSTAAVRNETSKAFANADEWIDLKLVKIESLSKDSKHFTFDLPSKDQVSGLVTASCVLAKFVTPKGSNVIRPYTPVSDVNQKGQLEFVIKHYEGGKFTTHLFGLEENDIVSFKGPILKWKWEPNQFKSVALIAGGTGITPLYQLLHEITKNPEDKTEVKLFYGSKTPEDILLRKEIAAIAAKHPQVSVTYFVDSKAGSSDDTLNEGYITKEFIAANFAKPSADNKVFVCGPPPFYNAVSGAKISPSDQGEVTGALGELGFTKENVFKF
ncbi:hypothetical protein BABINDRAFT_160352 [Babjeviella inositovora NRRL Y-12698]|uniref:NADH-cytochrome b5 reductase n=1 Tax=Babjeviella inositovora NRRL Y-12698 TaxID=984486 RepID=A0A1E3QVB1_9ASCO|nr:uncharacterized protein BABINDRAFT_160352 [Babjeviella inositovora NRRL Y-12698]ODQ80907.1 hypothetical protein BABINDRAFT_160352 [Babjeviella inositovora NRRL Y-12698]